MPSLLSLLCGAAGRQAAAQLLFAAVKRAFGVQPRIGLPSAQPRRHWNEIVTTMIATEHANQRGGALCDAAARADAAAATAGAAGSRGIRRTVSVAGPVCLRFRRPPSDACKRDGAATFRLPCRRRYSAAAALAADRLARRPRSQPDRRARRRSVRLAGSARLARPGAAPPPPSCGARRRAPGSAAGDARQSIA